MRPSVRCHFLSSLTQEIRVQEHFPFAFYSFLLQASEWARSCKIGLSNLKTFLMKNMLMNIVFTTSAGVALCRANSNFPLQQKCVVWWILWWSVRFRLWYPLPSVQNNLTKQSFGFHISKHCAFQKTKTTCSHPPPTPLRDLHLMVQSSLQTAGGKTKS